MFFIQIVPSGLIRMSMVALLCGMLALEVGCDSENTLSTSSTVTNGKAKLNGSNPFSYKKSLESMLDDSTIAEREALKSIISCVDGMFDAVGKSKNAYYKYMDGKTKAEILSPKFLEKVQDDVMK